MSVQYTFNLGINEPLDTLIGQIAHECGMRYDDHGVYPGGIFPTLVADGIIAAIMPQTPLGDQVIRESYGFGTSALISCTVDKFESYLVGMQRLLRLCAILAVNLTCDFVLLVNGETGWLLRKNGLIFLDERDENWRKHWTDVLAEYGLVVTLANLPSL